MTTSRIPAPVEHRDSAQSKGIVVAPGQAALESRQPGEADYRLAETPQSGVRGQWPQSRIAATDPNRPPRLEGSGKVAPLVQSGQPGPSAQTGQSTQPSQSAQPIQPSTEPTITREPVTPSANATAKQAPSLQAIPAQTDGNKTDGQSPKVAVAKGTAAKTTTKKPTQTEPGTSRSASAAKKPADAKPAPQKTQQLAAAKASTEKKPTASEPRASKPKEIAAGSAKFIWPAHGALVQKFADKKSMGIGISGRAGDRVNATADGEVIFSGLGPRGYGKLLIVKHNPEILSVYAHNRSLLVKEGQAVRQGQKIAELGSTGTDRPKLHFEIRRQGKPVDPLAFLPSRK